MKLIRWSFVVYLLVGISVGILTAIGIGAILFSSQEITLLPVNLVIVGSVYGVLLGVLNLLLSIYFLQKDIVLSSIIISFINVLLILFLVGFWFIPLPHVNYALMIGVISSLTAIICHNINVYFYRKTSDKQ